MKMNNALVYRRRRFVVFVVIPAFALCLLVSYATRDLCYVGSEHGNSIGYGSCMAMIDRVIEQGK
jgi:hypothetical protein